MNPKEKRPTFEAIEILGKNARGGTMVELTDQGGEKTIGELFLVPDIHLWGIPSPETGVEGPRLMRFELEV